MTRISGLVAAGARFLGDRLGHDSLAIRFLRPAYERVLARLSGERGLPWSINGVPCRIHYQLRDRIPREYEVGAARFLGAHVRPGELCLDVGANVGAYVIQLAHWSRPDGRVIAFEPNPAAAELLERHLRFNDLAHRVEVVRAAVGDVPGTAVLHAAGADGRGRLNQPNPELAGQTKPANVRVTTLDAFCTTHGVRPNWILIDIEGFEIAALSGGWQTLTARPRPGIVVEMHPSVWHLSGTTRAAAEALFGDLGVSPVPLSGQTDPYAEHGLVHLAEAAKV
jgi:FkbM family methyltransferase